MEEAPGLICIGFSNSLIWNTPALPTSGIGRNERVKDGLERYGSPPDVLKEGRGHLREPSGATISRIRALAAPLSRTRTTCEFEVSLGVGNSLAFGVTTSWRMYNCLPDYTK